MEEALTEGTPLTGTVLKQIKGGAVVDVGLRGFLPTSLVGDVPGTKLSELVGTEVEVLVVELDRPKDRIVVSIRDLQRRRRRAAEKELLRSLTPGSRATGTVVSLADYGAVVDLGGARGLIHRSELTGGRLESIESIVSVGDQVEVVVLDVNCPSAASVCRCGPPRPTLRVGRGGRHRVGHRRARRRVRRVHAPRHGRRRGTGAHLGALRRAGLPADQLVTPGEQLMVKVLEVDRKRRRLALSVRRVLVDD